ncbi:MAG: amino acid transporter [Candidatus Dactylopiibacterium carminicum]|uniref:Amino acid transporter n=1 Tax=Candidatus Dactylopiibacterium carminicum TaxID=857335 RepID=A0A272EPP4_9RHOO|nr:LysE/ArgO family amino acid transporter [Candidatus Dactylopiibacterium carminicum]KAF7598482.1 amino acid transporter [Candidatus Dactylopiibacterium carminicum]PAS92077.1 MAG: amino acid transporter [Candidatus Dactylopiibacterium carminicum]PAS95499.1 MAG: amino acid transporter [Candidatus Dactylopiibacterium carminicum]PAS97881.1 MAG: amino acid transporter [Candidatus Dactylopiibacterium carminicum]
MYFDAFIHGFFICAGLIIAIGAQNAHVLRMGLTRQHVGLLVPICIASDALLIGLGVLGASALVTRWPAALEVATWAGAAFLLWYGINSLREAFRTRQLSLGGMPTPISRRKAVLLLLGFTYLNPHVYVDTIVLIGSLATQHAVEARISFWAGCVLASAVWFVLLGYGARWLAPLFNRPLSWRVLDGGIGVGMTLLAVRLVLH